MTLAKRIVLAGIAALLCAPVLAADEIGPPIVIAEKDYIRFALSPENAAYLPAPEGLSKDMAAIVAISQKSKKDGNQYWGRIAGTRYDHMASDYMQKRFREIGLSGITRIPFNLPAQWMPRHWRMTVRIGGKDVALATAFPVQNSVGAKALSADAVWVGLGTAADFQGRDVKGKAVVVYTWPTPGGLTHTAAWNGAFKRAIGSGAAMVVLVSGFPGNFQHHILNGQPPGARETGANTTIPAMTIGQGDGNMVREALEKGDTVRFTLDLDVKREEGLKTQNVWATLPGQAFGKDSDEVIIVMAHHDAFFDGALDNASGMAMLLAIAEHYAKLPKEQRKRTLMFVDTASHHGSGDTGPAWIREHRKDLLAKTALIVNCEHAAQTQTYFLGPRLMSANMEGGRRWFVGGSPALKDMFLTTMRDFGVALYAGMESRPGGELLPIYQAAPSFHLLDHIFYHTELDRLDYVPLYGVQRVTGAYIKMIDGANGMTMDAIGPAPKAPAP